MRLFTKELDTQLNRTTTQRKVKVEENPIVTKLNKFLMRKDILSLDNDKVDALRMLIFHLEDKKSMPVTRLVKFLKA